MSNTGLKIVKKANANVLDTVVPTSQLEPIEDEYLDINPKRLKKLNDPNLTDFRRLMITIEENMRFFTLTEFFMQQRNAGHSTPCEIHKLCATSLVSTLEHKAKYTQGAYNKLTKFKEKMKELEAVGDMKTYKKLYHKTRSLAPILMEGLNDIRQDLNTYFNNVQMLFKLVYSFENNIHINKVTDIKNTLLDLMKKTDTGLSNKDRTFLYDLNTFRNVVVHNEVGVVLYGNDWIVLADVIKGVKVIVGTLLERYKEELRLSSNEALRHTTMNKL
jgi:hypothetical protein